LRNPQSPLREKSDMLGHSRDDCALLPMIQPLIEGELAHISQLVCRRAEGSRVTNRKLEIECKIVDIADILSVAVATCRSAIDARRQQFKMRLPHRRLTVHGDPVRLVQIFSNLLDNAAKYTQEGGKIALTVAQLEHSLQIAVSDNGIGVAGNLLPGLFGRPVEDTLVTPLHDGDGAGGLVLVRDLVEAHGGRVVCRSAGRKLGSEFIVTLPRAAG
jgi:signal transduction histidine kinase